MSESSDSIPQAAQIPMSQEFVRKLIHLSSLWMPIAYIYIQRVTMLWIVGSLVVVAFIIELLRRKSPASEKLVQRYLGSMLREHERDSGKARLSGATYVLLSSLICVVMFPKVIAITAFSVLIVSDSAAALIGRTFGRHKFLDKSFEGSAAFFASAVLVGVLVSIVFATSMPFVAIASIAALVATIAEALSHTIHMDDNFSVPVSYGLTLWPLLALIHNPEFIRLLSMQ